MFMTEFWSKINASLCILDISTYLEEDVRDAKLSTNSKLIIALLLNVDVVVQYVQQQ